MNRVESNKPQGKPRKCWRVARWGAMACGFIVVLLGLTTRALVLKQPTLPSVELDSAAAVRLETRIQEADARAATGKEDRIEAGEKETNSLLSSYLSANQQPSSNNGKAQLTDVRVKLNQDRMRICLVLGVNHKALVVEFEGKVSTVNGYLRFEPLSGSIGSLPIPRSSLEAATRRMMQSDQGRRRLRLPKNIRDVHVSEGKIVVTY